MMRMTNPENNLRDYNANPAATTPADIPDPHLNPLPEGEEANASLRDYHFSVSDEYAGLRLDQVLVKFLPEYSRSRLQEWVLQQQVLVNGAPALSKDKMWGGEKISVNPQAHIAEQPYIAEDIALDIVFEDDEIMVINKPVGLVVHPGNGNWEGTLLNALLHYAPQLKDVPRAGIVHRLDKDTSGLMVVAKTLIAQTALVRQLQDRSVKREYLALVWGEIARGGTVDADIDRHPSNRVKMAVVEGGKPAVTHYVIERHFPSSTLLRCRLETGRTHQIRVHMAHLKHPLIGDAVYIQGGQKCVPYLRTVLNAFPRQALHATRLALEHPSTGERMEWHVNMPEDMQVLLREVQREVKDAVERDKLKG
jgi:23S rRNA pseudouridine1911/1915/1917 synthase